MISRTYTIVMVLMVLLLITVGTSLILPSPSWLKAALAFYLYGKALGPIIWSPFLSGIRHRVRLSKIRSMRLWAATRLLSGGLFLIGAITSFKPVFAAVASLAAFCWLWMWGYILWQSRDLAAIGSQD